MIEKKKLLHTYSVESRNESATFGQLYIIHTFLW